MLTIAVDAMGGDFGPHVTVPGALKCLDMVPDLKLILVGDESQLSPYIPQDKVSHVEILHTDQFVSMDEKPSRAIRSLPKSSMKLAMQLVAEGKADAIVSAGNTGALMAIGRHVLSTLPGIDRPAIMARLPVAEGATYMLDLGANVDCQAEHLYQFAVMGAAFAAANGHVVQPKIALLNVGVESTKGNQQVKLASHQIAQSEGLNYIGFVEGNEIFTGKADVIVCDGFVGNVALKASESVMKLAAERIQQKLSVWWLRWLGLIIKPLLHSLSKELDPTYLNGALLVGLQGIVVKSHGGSDEAGFTNAVMQAYREVSNQSNQHFESFMEQIEF
jgi:glycerol-3-phosphate acyltransferase PlsX